DAPEWMVWNPYVRSGYRVGARWLGATRSIFMLHNETVNIWSHLLGVLMFAALIVQTFRTAHSGFVPDDPEPARPVTRWPMYIFLTGAVVCLFFSTMCHTYCCVGEIDAERMWRFDYLGIAVLIVASFYPMLHYSYYCLPGWRDMYLTGITVFGCLTVVPTFMRAFQKKEYAPLRASLFVALGCLGLFPIFQQVFFVWHIVPTPMMEAFYFEMAMGFGYVFGAFLYAKMIPERWSPGSFDFFGCSHNIFHFLIVLSTYFHYRASIIYLTWRDNYTC
ncbi:predicted protein, partial [Ostreococcus lucimarinus CCE9901]